MTPEWIRLTRPSGKPRHLHVSHLVSVSPSTGGSEIEMTGHEYNVRETDEEIMALLGVDARPAQPDKQPARTTIIIGRETLVSLANRQAVVVGNVTMIDGDNFPRGLFLSPATPSEEPQPTGAAPELGALQEAQNERVRGESPIAGADPPWLDEAVAAQQWQPIETAPKDRIIDLWCDCSKKGYADRSERSINCEWDDRRGWVDDDGDAIERGPDQYGRLRRVTHWMLSGAPK